ncbi:hypothetical protein SRIMM317S_03195 [Streptomyces rimosus subsp. rimosus]
MKESALRGRPIRRLRPWMKECLNAEGHCATITKPHTTHKITRTHQAAGPSGRPAPTPSS